MIKQLDHPNIVKLYEIFEDKHHVYIVNELMAEELLERMTRLKKCSESQVAYLVYQIILTIAYLHSKKIVHRDIKLENVLMNSLDIEDFKAKLTDFGFSKMYNDENLNQMLGSPLYMAPEIIKK